MSGIFNGTIASIEITAHGGKIFVRRVTGAHWLASPRLNGSNEIDVGSFKIIEISALGTIESQASAKCGERVEHESRRYAKAHYDADDLHPMIVVPSSLRIGGATAMAGHGFRVIGWIVYHPADIFEVDLAPHVIVGLVNRVKTLMGLWLGKWRVAIHKPCGNIHGTAHHHHRASE